MTVFSIDPEGKPSPLAQFKATRFDEGPSAEILRRQAVPLASASNDLDVIGQAFPSAAAVRSAEAVTVGVDLASGPDRTVYSIVRPGRVDLVLSAADLDRLKDGRLFDLAIQPIGDAE
jgi:hypothetical protein